ncbi:kelch-like protein 11 [Saccoglossus kowalevskii]|uniref:Kelch-like protein 11-like n=1 Tax=Saccoglossus kowalevskii TaxID=10224 RepID=A0ABM0GWF2_SACKO|nr:PREDICTED: kelch-like protein 11-like [Saccoglossus kowalevskii]
MAAQTLCGESFGKISHSSDLLRRLEHYRESGELCDMTLVIEGLEFKAHRVVLAGSSPYFESLFHSNLQESQTGRVELICTSPDGLECILKYMYSGRIEITADNVYDILKAADHLMITEVKGFCETFMEKQLTSSNCLQVRDIAELYDLMKLKASAEDAIECNFCDLLTQESFLNLSAERVCSMMSNENIKVKREEEIFEFVVRWTNKDINERKEHFPRLMSCVRLCQVDKKYLLDVVEKNKLVEENTRCREYVREAIRYHMVPEEDVVCHNLRLQPRPCRLVDLLVMAGGTGYDINGSFATNTAYGYVFCEDRWVTLPPLPEKISRSPAVAMDNKMIVIGGSLLLDNSNHVSMFDPLVSEWKTLPETRNPHRFGESVICNGRIYVLGGSLSPRSLEVFDPDHNCWIEKASSMDDHAGFEMVVLNNRYIYAMGIREGGLIEYYDTHTDQWFRVSESESWCWKQMNWEPTCQIFPPLIMETPTALEFSGLGRYKVAISKMTRRISLENSDINLIPDPPKRKGSVVRDIGDHGIFVYGGVQHLPDGSECLDNSAYLYKHSSKTWKELAPARKPIMYPSCALVQIPYSYISSCQGSHGHCSSFSFTD